MADVKTIIKQMRDAGMADTDILANLKELGIENAENEIAKVISESTPSQKPKQDTESGLRITKISGESEQTVDIGKVIEGTNNSNNNLMKGVASSDLSNVDEMEDKLDQIIALLKALEDINKKILETNRDLLVKMNRKEQEASKPKLDKLF